jgi:hypothetical protein
LNRCAWLCVVVIFVCACSDEGASGTAADGGELDAFGMDGAATDARGDVDDGSTDAEDAALADSGGGPSGDGDAAPGDAAGQADAAQDAGGSRCLTDPECYVDTAFSECSCLCPSPDGGWEEVFMPSWCTTCSGGVDVCVHGECISVGFCQFIDVDGCVRPKEDCTPCGYSEGVCRNGECTSDRCPDACDPELCEEE